MELPTRLSPKCGAVVDHIVASNRQPTAWEAGCLYAALCELAIGREKNARRRICLAFLPDAQQDCRSGYFPCPQPRNCCRPWP